jgi:site-specific recombinase XerD
MLIIVGESNPEADRVNALTVSEKAGLEAIKALVLDAVSSPKTKVLYSQAVDEFLNWYRITQPGPLSKATVQRYKAELEGQGLSASSVNVRLAAIRKLVTEAADNGLLDPETAASIRRVKGAKKLGVRIGNWLSQAQAQTLLNLPDVQTLKGKRDQALLAVMLGTGLRRSELAALTFESIQQREGRWVAVDLLGKHGRVRSVPMASWIKAAIDSWSQSAGISEGRVFRAVNKGGQLSSVGMTAQAVYNTLAGYAQQMGLTLAPHDMRRTFAQLARKGNAPLEQIQLTLGHASIQTTERYLGTRQDLVDSPSDRVGLRI